MNVISLASLVNLGVFIYAIVAWLIPMMNVALWDILSLSLMAIVGALVMWFIWFPLTVFLLMIGAFAWVID